MKGGGGSSSSEMAVYDFDADEMALEAEDTKRTAKFHCAVGDDKYAFLQDNFSSLPDKTQTEEAECNFKRLMQFSADHHHHLNFPGNGENNSSHSESEPSDDDEDEYEPENNGYFEEQAYDNTCYPSSIIKHGEIMLRTDHMICGSLVYIDSIFTFNSDGIKIEGKDFEDQDFEMECSIDDIFHINIMPNSTGQSASMKIVLRHDGVVKLSIDSDAQEMEYMIKNLSQRYMEIWNSVLIEENLSGVDQMVSTSFFPKCYFNGIPDNFGEVIYPKGDPDAVSIRKSDIDLLLPETFVNDTIIDFYIKYLNNNISERKRKRLHFFNSFFFRKLADLDKGKSIDGRAAFLKVKKWTRKFNIFDKDFIFIPVNFNLHWSLLVICHPGEIAKTGGETIMACKKVPCILHMDSLKGNHDGVMTIIQSYLWEEWKEKNTNCTEDYSSKFLNLRFLSLDCPQQDNCYDCGLFLLHYVEKFLEDCPLHFNPSKSSNNNSNFLNPDWFPPADASHKRAVIRKLIYDLLSETSITHNVFSQGNDEMVLDQEDQEEEDSGIELLSQQPVLTQVCQLDRDATGDDSQLEMMDITEPVKTIEPEATCILDDEEECEARLCTIVSTDLDTVYEECLNCQSDNEKDLLEETGKNLLEEKENKLVEERGKKVVEQKENLLEVPGSPKPDISGYVPDTPIIGQNENSIISQNGNVGLVPETPIVSDDVEKSELQNAVVPDTPMVDSTPVPSQNEEESEKENQDKCVLLKEMIILDSPVASQKEEKCVLTEEKEEKLALSEEAIVLDSPVVSQKEEGCVKKKQEKHVACQKEVIELESPVASQKEECTLPEPELVNIEDDNSALGTPVEEKKKRDDVTESAVENEEEFDTFLVEPEEGCIKNKQEKCVSSSEEASQKEVKYAFSQEESVLEPPVISGDINDDCMETDTGVVEITEIPSITVAPFITVEVESSKESSFRISSEDVVISDDEGSVEQTPRKRRRKEFNLPEGSRRLTRSASKGSAAR